MLPVRLSSEYVYRICKNCNYITVCHFRHNYYSQKKLNQITLSYHRDGHMKKIACLCQVWEFYKVWTKVIDHGKSKFVIRSQNFWNHFSRLTEMRICNAKTNPNIFDIASFFNYFRKVQMYTHYFRTHFLYIIYSVEQILSRNYAKQCYQAQLL